MHSVLLAAVLAISAQDQLDGAEVGDAQQFIHFQSQSKFYAERADKQGKTVAHGTWKFEGDHLEVKISSCKGPACGVLGKSFGSDVQVTAERALTVKTPTEGTALSTGSYYCRYQGCEKRTGVELMTHSARPLVMKYLVDLLIDKNRARDVTVVWWGKKAAEPQPVSHIQICKREEKKARAGAELVQKDLAELPWVGTLPVKDATAPDCLWDVQVVVGDDVKIPAKR